MVFHDEDIAGRLPAANLDWQSSCASDCLWRSCRMFLGHFGLGFAGKRIAPDMSLGSLFLAVQFADLLFWILTIVGAEHFRISPGATRVTPMDFYDYPYSHSLFELAV